MVVNRCPYGQKGSDWFLLCRKHYIQYIAVGRLSSWTYNQHGGVSDMSVRAGEGVGGMVNGAGITSKSIARSGASGGGSTVGTETHVEMSDRWGFGKKVLG